MAGNNQSQDLLKSVIEAHGGLERFNQVKSIQCTFNFTGIVLEIKGHGGHVRQPTITINTKGEPHTIYTNLDRDNPTDRWIFTPNKVWIENAQGKLLQERENPRSAYPNHTLGTPWDDLHLHYFASYAMYNYLTIPWLFTQPDFSIRELEPHSEYNQTWRVLEVTHPDGFPTHTKIQRFYFGAHNFLMKRMDYEVDVMGGVAAHYVFDYKRVGGLMFPTTRRVVRRTKGTREGHLGAQTAFWLQYTEVRAVDEDGEVWEEAERVVTG